MAKTMSFQMTPETKARLEGLTREMQKMTGAESAKVVRNVGRDLCWAALRLTPAVKAEKGPVWLDHKKLGAWVPWHRKSAPGGILRVSSGGGLTKAGWLAALMKLGVAVNKPPGNRTVRAWGFSKEVKQSGTIGLEVGHQAPWIEDFDKGKNPLRHPLHITERAAQAVSKTMDKRLTDMAAKMAETWNGFRR